MRCLYCDEEIRKVPLANILYGDDLLCNGCREKITKNHLVFDIEGLETEVFYDYDSLFRTLLLQYKECYDEALKDVFLYGIEDILKWKYHGYAILYVPSSQKKMKERGFLPLRGIFERLDFKEVKGLELKEERIQEGRSKKEREKMRENYIYTGPPLKKVLIVDDVVTTGSSLIGVYQAISSHAEKVKAVCLGIKIPVKGKEEKL